MCIYYCVGNVYTILLIHFIVHFVDRISPVFYFFLDKDINVEPRRLIELINFQLISQNPYKVFTLRYFWGRRYEIIAHSSTEKVSTHIFDTVVYFIPFRQDSCKFRFQQLYMSEGPRITYSCPSISHSSSPDTLRRRTDPTPPERPTPKENVTEPRCHYTYPKGTEGVGGWGLGMGSQVRSEVRETTDPGGDTTSQGQVRGSQLRTVSSEGTRSGVSTRGTTSSVWEAVWDTGSCVTGTGGSLPVLTGYGVSATVTGGPSVTRKRRVGVVSCITVFCGAQRQRKPRSATSGGTLDVRRSS